MLWLGWTEVGVGSDIMGLDYSAGNYEAQAEAHLQQWPEYQAYRAKLEAFYQRFAGRHALRTLRAWKDVYRAVLLDKAWHAISTLRSLAGVPPLPESAPDERWSLREADGAVRAATGAAPTGGPIGIRPTRCR